MNSLVLSEPSRPARSASDPDPEVSAKARRRTFTAKYKLDTLEEAEAVRRLIREDTLPAMQVVESTPWIISRQDLSLTNSGPVSGSGRA